MRLNRTIITSTGSFDLTVKELPGVPLVSNVNTIKVPTGTLIDEGAGVIQLLVSKYILNFGAVGKNLKTNWLNLNGGGPVSLITGHRIWKSSKLVSLSVETGDITTCTFKIFKNKTTEIASISLTNESAKHDITLNISLIAGDSLSCLMEVPSGFVSNPSINLELSMM